MLIFRARWSAGQTLSVTGCMLRYTGTGGASHHIKLKYILQVGDSFRGRRIITQNLLVASSGLCESVDASYV